MIWHDYVDESYNANTLCVGGWLAPLEMWEKIEGSWNRRIELERRNSIKKGLHPISRYHATDCANLKNEFDPKHGWDIDRQIRLCKRLCEIIGENGPCGVVLGGGINEIRKHSNEAPDETLKEGLYRMSFMTHLTKVGEVVNERFPGIRVSVFYERSKQFGPVAARAFNDFMRDPGMKHLSRYFVTAAPKGWEDCTALQPADLLAYEGMKRVDGSIKGRDSIRKALQALLGGRTPIHISHFTEENFQDCARVIGNQQS